MTTEPKKRVFVISQISSQFYLKQMCLSDFPSDHYMQRQVNHSVLCDFFPFFCHSVKCNSVSPFDKFPLTV